MNPLSALYGSVVNARNVLYDRNVFKARKLAWPVVSIGNLSVGGSGKTPFVITLGRLLAQRSIAVDVLTRGYGRSSRSVLSADADGTPELFGDEPLLIARKLHCPVFVGPNRYTAGILAEREPGLSTSTHMHLLDDGFQHRELHRDFNIVLINDQDTHDSLLPRGRLREPMASLRRADAVVVSDTFAVERLPIGNFEVWRARRRTEVPQVRGAVIGFCGIARPERFFEDLRQAGLDVRAEFRFRDHHRYSQTDISKLLAAQSTIAGAQLATTEKDAINLGRHLERLSPIVVPMHMELHESDSCLNYMLGVINERCRP